MKRCESRWDAATAAGVQALLVKLCGRLACEAGEVYPLLVREDRMVLVVSQHDQGHTPPEAHVA